MFSRKCLEKSDMQVSHLLCCPLMKLQLCLKQSLVVSCSLDLQHFAKLLTKRCCQRRRHSITNLAMLVVDIAPEAEVIRKTLQHKSNGEPSTHSISWTHHRCTLAPYIQGNKSTKIWLVGGSWTDTACIDKHRRNDSQHKHKRQSLQACQCRAPVLRQVPWAM